MRHVLLPGAITAGTRSMQKPATMARPVPPAGGTLCVAPGPIGTLTGAVDVAAIATAADHHLGAAAGTDEQPRRDRIVLIGPTGPQMTDAARAAILPRHACPGTVWCTVPKQTWQLDFGTVLAIYRAAPAPLAPASTIRRCNSSLTRVDRTRRRPALSQQQMTLRHHAKDETAPDLRGFRPPSTCEESSAAKTWANWFGLKPLEPFWEFR
jgi:hypothetical protein